MSCRRVALLLLAVIGCAGSNSQIESSQTPASAPVTQVEEARNRDSVAALAEDSSAATIAIVNAKQPLAGVVTGGIASQENLKEAQMHGYQTVVSLLATEDNAAEEAQVKELGMRFVSIPISGAADLTEINARKLGEVLDDPQSRPMIVHCASGNRAGAMIALYAFYVQKQPANSAIELGVQAGLTSLRPQVEQLVLSGAK